MNGRPGGQGEPFGINTVSSVSVEYPRSPALASPVNAALGLAAESAVAADRITLPKRARGRQSATAMAAYAKDVEAFCASIRKIDSTLDFSVSSRGWCYILEEHGLLKGEFDSAQDLINDCRKGGLLPIDICAVDTKREAENLERLDESDPEYEAAAWLRSVGRAHLSYTPFSFWDGLARAALRDAIVRQLGEAAP
jgi:hypothetical protein